MTAASRLALLAVRAVPDRRWLFAALLLPAPRSSASPFDISRCYVP